MRVGLWGFIERYKAIAYGIICACALRGNVENQTALIGNAGVTSYTLVNSGSGGSPPAIAPAVGSGRFRILVSPIDVPPNPGTTTTTYTACSPCSVTIDMTLGSTYVSQELLDSSGNPFSPPKIARLVFAQVEQPASASGSWTLPVEVISGADNYAIYKNVSVSGSVASNLSLYVRGHNLGYSHQLKTDGKCSVKVNGAAWQDITDANVTMIDEARYYAANGQGVGSNVNTREFTLPIANGVVVTGTNTLGFKKYLTDGNTSGCRILDVNFIEPSVVIDSFATVSNVTTITTHTATTWSTGDWIQIYGAPKMLARYGHNRQITKIDSTHFTFTPCGSSPHIVAGACTSPNETVTVPTSTGTTGSLTPPVAYGARELFAPIAYDDPTIWVAPVGADPVAGKKLFTTTSSGGFPLVNPSRPYYNYAISATCSNCHAADGRDLIEYGFSNWSIRQRSIFHGLTAQEGDNITAYLRGLGLTVQHTGRPWNPVYQPAPGLDSNALIAWGPGDGIDSLLQYGPDEADYMLPGGSAAALAPDQYLNMRELPLQYALQDWLQWLPKIYPPDYYGSAFDPVLTNYNGMATALASSCGTMSSCLTAFYAQGAFQSSDNMMGTWRAQPVFATPFNQGAPGWSLPAALGAAYDSALHWMDVKSWEIMHGYALEGQSDTIRTHYNGASTYGYYARGWDLDEPFFTGAHIAHTSPFSLNVGTTNDETVQSNSWYFTGSTLGCGNRRASGNQPCDFGYLSLFEFNMGQLRPNDFIMDVSYFMFPQVFYDQNSIVSGNTFNPIVLSTRMGGLQGSGWWYGFTTPTQKLPIYTAYVNTLQAVLNRFAPGGDWTNWQTALAGTACCSPFNGYVANTVFLGDNIAYMLPVLHNYGVDNTLLTNLAANAHSIWPSYNFAAQLAVDSSGVVNTSGTSVTFVSGTNFANWIAGFNIVINGVTYNIQTVNSNTSLTLTGSAGTQTGVTYSGCVNTHSGGGADPV